MSEWISVEERLPKDREPVWLRLSDDRIFVGLLYMDFDGYSWCNSYGDFYYSAENEQWETFTTEADDEYDVTHWMPLPEPPK